MELLRGKIEFSAYQSAVDAAREYLEQRASSGGAENFLADFLRRWQMP
jgi:hypothetical protein